MRSRLLSTAVVVTWAFGVAGPAAAQDKVAEFYKSKQITIVIGSSAGGGYDAYARLVARHLGRFLPGNPAVVPSNMPGAGSATAARHIYSAAPKDGTAIGAVYPRTLTDPLLSAKPVVGYDPSKFIYVGSANREVTVCMVRGDAPIKTFADVLKQEMIVGATSGRSSSREYPSLANKVLGTKFKIVSGYPGAREIYLAIEKGEVQGSCGTSWAGISSLKQDWLKSGFAKPLSQQDGTGHPVLNKMGVPREPDFAKTPADKQVLELVYGEQALGRPYVLPPGVPADRVAALRKAFITAMRDPGVQAEAARIKLDLQSDSGEDLQKMLERMYATPKEIVERAKAVLNTN